MSEDNPLDDLLSGAPQPQQAAQPPAAPAPAPTPVGVSSGVHPSHSGRSVVSTGVHSHASGHSSSGAPATGPMSNPARVTQIINSLPPEEQAMFRVLNQFKDGQIKILNKYLSGGRSKSISTLIIEVMGRDHYDKCRLLVLRNHASRCLVKTCSYPGCAKMKHQYFLRTYQTLSHTRKCTPPRKCGHDECARSWELFDHIVRCKEPQPCQKNQYCLRAREALLMHRSKHKSDPTCILCHPSLGIPRQVPARTDPMSLARRREAVRIADSGVAVDMDIVLAANIDEDLERKASERRAEATTLGSSATFGRDPISSEGVGSIVQEVCKRYRLKPGAGVVEVERSILQTLVKATVKAAQQSKSMHVRVVATDKTRASVEARTGRSKTETIVSSSELLRDGAPPARSQTSRPIGVVSYIAEVARAYVQSKGRMVVLSQRQRLQHKRYMQHKEFVKYDDPGPAETLAKAHGSLGVVQPTFESEEALRRQLQHDVKMDALALSERRKHLKRKAQSVEAMALRYQATPADFNVRDMSMHVLKREVVPTIERSVEADPTSMPIVQIPLPKRRPLLPESTRTGHDASHADINFATEDEMALVCTEEHLASKILADLPKA